MPRGGSAVAQKRLLSTALSKIVHKLYPPEAPGPSPPELLPEPDNATEEVSAQEVAVYLTHTHATLRSWAIECLLTRDQGPGTGTTHGGACMQIQIHKRTLHRLTRAGQAVNRSPESETFRPNQVVERWWMVVAPAPKTSKTPKSQAQPWMDRPRFMTYHKFYDSA